MSNSKNPSRVSMVETAKGPEFHHNGEVYSLTLEKEFQSSGRWWKQYAVWLETKRAYVRSCSFRVPDTASRDSQLRAAAECIENMNANKAA